MCCVRGVARNVLRAGVLRMVRCGRRASRKRVRGSGGLKRARCVTARNNVVVVRGRVGGSGGAPGAACKARCGAVGCEADGARRVARAARRAVRSAREPEVSTRRRRAEGPAVSRRVGALVAVVALGERCDVALGERCVCVCVRKARSVLRAWRVARCAVRSTHEPEASARRLRAGGPLRCGGLGRLGCACSRVTSRRREMLRYGRRAKRTARNVLRACYAAHRAVRSGVYVWIEARNVLRAWRVTRCAARSTREPEASARRRRAEGTAASRRVGAFVVSRACVC